MSFRSYEHVETVGSNKVKDATAFAWQCKCGEAELTLDELAGYQRRAAAIVLREAKNLDGPVIKYARKAIGFTQAELADHIECRSETMSRYETGSLVVPRHVCLAIVAVLDGVERAGGVQEYLAEDDRHSKVFEVPPPRRACV